MLSTVKFPVYEVTFFVFAAILIFAATMVVLSRHPIRSILFLVLAFFASSVLWLLIQAEFLALVLIFVYVGAVMTLFLFVVMMLDIDKIVIKEGFVRYLPWALMVLAAFIGIMIYVIAERHMQSITVPLVLDPNYSNTAALGQLLFTQYVYPFEIAGVILLVAIIAAIALAFHGRKPDTKSQDIKKQLQATKAERLRIVSFDKEQP